MSSGAAANLGGLVERARGLVVDGRRAMLGVTGLPGSGKSYFAERLTAALAARHDADLPADWVRYVPMDGFHLAQAELERLGRGQRKGAPDTFDGYGFVALLARIADGADREEVVYAPTFDRRLEEPVAGSIAIPGSVRLVITEGNYLLLPEQPWSKAREYLSETWYCDTDADRQQSQLLERHMAFGKSAAEAAEWMRTTDQVNATRIAAHRHRADLFVPERVLLSLEDEAARKPGPTRDRSGTDVPA